MFLASSRVMCNLKAYVFFRRLAHKIRIGPDYLPTDSACYGTTPDTYGDAHSLPIRTESLDDVALLDMLEYLPNPEKALLEVRRVLKRGEDLILHVPCLSHS